MTFNMSFTRRAPGHGLLGRTQLQGCKNAPQINGPSPSGKGDEDQEMTFNMSFTRRAPGHGLLGRTQLQGCKNAPQINGPSPSGKAPGFDPGIRWFDSSRPSHI